MEALQTAEHLPGLYRQPFFGLCKDSVLARVFPNAFLISLTTSHIQTFFYNFESQSVLKWEIEFNTPVLAISKCLRVLIAAFECQVKAVDRHLN